MSNLSVIHDDVATIVFLQANRIIDETVITQLGRELMAVVSETNGKMLVDFSAVNFMSSAMLGKLMQAQKSCKMGKVEMRLCGISSSIMEAFRSTGLHRQFRIHTNREEALKAFQKKGWLKLW